jgi:hypothetical protein
MSRSLLEYIRIKDQVCIGYYGAHLEYLIQLKLLFPNIKSTFPDLCFTLSCQDRFVEYLQSLSVGEPCNILPVSQLKVHKKEFGLVTQIVDLGPNTIQSFCRQNNIPLEIKTPPPHEEGHKGIISVSGTDRSLTPEQMLKIMGIIKEKGLRSEFGEDDLTDVSWVVGVESPLVYKAAASGIKTTLIEPDDHSPFTKMFPGYERLEI